MERQLCWKAGVAGVKPDYNQRTLFLLELIVVVIDVGPVSVRAVVPRADGGVFVVVVLATLVVGSSMVHPVGEVGLQSL